MEEKKSTSALGLVVLFFALSLGGIVLSWLYLGLVDLIPFIYLNILTAIGFGLACAGIVSAVKKHMNITSAVGAVIVVLLALFVINVMRWQMFFALNFASNILGYRINLFLDLRVFIDAVIWIFEYPFVHGINPVSEFFADLRHINEFGTWGFQAGSNVTGWLLGAIWTVELLIICLIPLAAAVADTTDVSKVKMLPYEFEEFTQEEINRIAVGDDEIYIITSKPLAFETGQSKVHKIGIFPEESKATELIGIFKAQAGAAAGTEKLLRTIALPPEKIHEIVDQLSKKHGAPSAPEVPPSE